MVATALVRSSRATWTSSKDAHAYGHELLSSDGQPSAKKHDPSPARLLDELPSCTECIDNSRIQLRRAVFPIISLQRRKSGEPFATSFNISAHPKKLNDLELKGKIVHWPVWCRTFARNTILLNPSRNPSPIQALRRIYAATKLHILKAKRIPRHSCPRNVRLDEGGETRISVEQRWSRQHNAFRISN